MDVILSKEDPDLQECEVLVTGFFEDERPLKGTTGLLDWRLNGRLSRLLQQRRIDGRWQEATLVASNGRTRSPLILLMGLGRAGDYSTLRLRDLSPYLFNLLRNLRSSKVCLSFPADGEYNIDCGKSVEVLLEGMVDSLDAGPPSDEEWVNRLQVFFPAEGEAFSRMLLGVQTAQAILGDRLRIRILTESEAGLGFKD